MNILINVNDITVAQRQRIVNLIAELPKDKDLDICEHEERPDWLVVDTSEGRIEMDDLGCMRTISYSDWSGPA